MALHYEKTQTRVGFGTEKETKFVGRRRLADPFTLERLAKEIAHETGMRQATCETVLRYMVLAVEDAIQDGRSVDIGIGTVSPTISTVASDTAEGVKVRKKRILFRPSKQLRTIVENMKVRLITDETDDLDDDADDIDGGSTDPGNDSGTTESGNHGNTDGGSSVDPNPVNPDPAAAGPFTITAVVSGTGGTISIKKNGQAVTGSSVQAMSSDTVELLALDDTGFQFMGWSDGNSQNPRTITPSRNLRLEASFLDLSKI